MAARIHTLLFYIITGIFLTAVFSCIFTGCSRSMDNSLNGKKIKVAVSIPPQAEFVEKVGGENVDVMVMIPPGASPHTHEVTPAQLEEISRARMYAKVGSGIEFEIEWMDKILKINSEMLVVNCAEGVKFIASDDRYGKDYTYYEYNEIGENITALKGVDPHIWLSPGNAKIMSENIYNGLVKIDAENQKYYRENLDNFTEELENLDRELSQIFEGKKNKAVMVYHPGWTYFASDYGINQISIEKEGKEPTAEAIRNLIDYAKKYSIKVVFASPESSTRSAETIAEEIGGSVVPVSSLEKDYIENLRRAAEAFAGAMD